MSEQVPNTALSSLYDDLDFLGGIMDNQKYCFGKRYYVGLDWYGIFLRMRDSESQDINGSFIMGNICTNTAQQWDVYKDHPVFGKILLDKIIKARHGLARVIKTYKSIQKNVTASSIENKAIIILDNLIPHHIKINEGILLPDNSKSPPINNIENFNEIDLENN